MLFAAALFVAYLAIRHGGAHLRATSLMLRFADEHATGTLASFGNHPVREEDATVALASGSARARVYFPADVEHAPGVVIVHGVHRLGIDEPRLMRFARAIARAGVAVLTPEVAEIAGYRVDPISIDTIGAAAKSFHARLGAEVGVMGMSFAGGLSLLAAADPRYADDVKFVLAVGAHDDLGRVARYFMTSRAERPDGTSLDLPAHEYGAVVFVHSRAEAFFAPSDVPIARDAIRLWLWEKRDEARARTKEMSPEGAARALALFDGKLDVIRPTLLASLDSLGPSMSAVSPRDHLAGIKAPVFLLHGAGDNVIPPTETEWLERDVPAPRLAGALVSEAIQHVEIHGDPSLSDKWALVHFMARVLEEADR